MAHSYSNEHVLRRAMKAAKSRFKGATWQDLPLNQRANAIYREVRRIEAKYAVAAAEFEDATSPFEANG